MNKSKPLWRKNSLTILSLGFIFLGIGCISWALFSIWTQSNNSAYATPSSYSVPTTFAAKQVESDPSFDLSAPAKNLYPVYPGEGDNIGSLTIPALNRKLPILQGTGVNELKKGVGHFTQSVLPGEEDHCVLSGHRETVFSQLYNLQIEDTLIVETSAGKFTYEVTGTRIVHEDDKTVIVPSDHAVLTLITCYPFYTPGYFPDRYIVSATLVKSE